MKSEQILEKLSTRNIIALAVTGTILTVVMQMTFNPQIMIVIIKENTEWVVAGSIIFGALLAKWSDIIQFFFRRTQPQ